MDKAEKPASTLAPDKPRAIAKVEHAPYNPKIGLFWPRSPRAVAVHWFVRSPEKMQSRSSSEQLAFFKAAAVHSRTISDSAFSQVSDSNLLSGSERSKLEANGPFNSNPPHTAAPAMTEGLFLKVTRCCAIKPPPSYRSQRALRSLRSVPKSAKKRFRTE